MQAGLFLYQFPIYPLLSHGFTDFIAKDLIIFMVDPDPELVLLNLHFNIIDFC